MPPSAALSFSAGPAAPPSHSSPQNSKPHAATPWPAALFPGARDYPPHYKPPGPASPDRASKSSGSPHQLQRTLPPNKPSPPAIDTAAPERRPSETAPHPTSNNSEPKARR